MHLFFDTETTGLPKDYRAHVHDVDNWPRLVQLAWVAFDGAGEEMASRSHIITPISFKIPKEASDINGVTQERAVMEGIPIMRALGEFRVAVQMSHILVGHNINFDRKVTGAEFIRFGMEDTYEHMKTMERYCTMFKSTKICKIPQVGRGGYKWPKLQELHKHLFDEEFDGAHDALADVRATARCYFEIKDNNLDI
jgi:DNA polymerase III epsilon subunit-like protein